MNLRILKRRAEILDAVSTGLHPAAVVTQLAEKYGVTERALWSDWQRREKWVPVLLSLEKYAEFAEMVEQKLNPVQKAAWSIYLKAGNESARVGALRTVLEALGIHRDIVQTRDVIERLYKLEEIAQKQKMHSEETSKPKTAENKLSHYTTLEGDHALPSDEGHTLRQRVSRTYENRKHAALHSVGKSAFQRNHG